MKLVSGLTVLLGAVALAQAQDPAATQGATPPAHAANSTAAAPAAAPSAEGAASRAAHPKHSKAAAATAAPEGDLKSRGSYSIGLSIGENLKSTGFTAETVSVEKIAQGMRDVLSGKAKASQTDQQNIVTLINTAHGALAAKNEAAAKSFLDENGRKPGVQTTKTGLQYRVLTPGSGDSPKLSDTVTVNYRGTLTDGSEFDSSYKRGEPASFPLNNVIPGWQEGLALMKPGAKYELFIPPNLAYGSQGRPSIPPNSVLKFEVELLSAKPTPAAASSEPSAPGQQNEKAAAPKKP